ncbi:MAG: DUF4143 domain-containing protein [Bifidobacteriaceae bacterium]|nr:DUF4143 domain-containing protein [Bifidobacteriaceae bacterium]
MIVERKKALNFVRDSRSLYFWRTWEKQELDLIEEKNGQLIAYEIKWNTNKRISVPRKWREAYGDTEFSLITPANFYDFIEVSD